MTRKLQAGLGLLILGAVVAVVVGQRFLGETELLTEGAPPDEVTVTGYHGGEKSGFLRNEAVRKRLRAKHGITVSSTKAGSVEMVRTLSIGDKDCIWPSNDVATEFYRSTHGAPLAVENVFRSPLVLYAWDGVADALASQGIARQQGELWYVDMVELVALVERGAAWKDVGLAQLYGKVKILSTDPTRSNSGNMFFGLLANMLNGGEVVDDRTIDTVLPKLVDYYRRMGHMEHSSGDIFANFLQQGMGAKPVIAGYENQLVEFALTHPEARELLRTRIRVLYPVPTVWSDHPLICVTPACKRLAEALHDPELQRLAWEQHGFRSGLMGVTNDPSVLDVVGVAESVDAVIPLPSASVMDRILRTLEGSG